MITASERIEAILRHGGFRNVTAFANLLGLNSPQKIYDIQSGKVKSIAPDLANKIFQVFPEINQEWILEGRGEMLRDGATSTKETADQDSVTITSAEVRELISQNGKLIDIIMELTKKQSV